MKKAKQTVKLANKHYPVGWGTGLNAKQWRKFAEDYPKKKEGEGKKK